MKPNIIYTSFDIRSNEPIDKRLYIDALTIPNLTTLFGSSGRYAIGKAFLFNRLDNQFYYFSETTTPNPNILNPSSWNQVQSSTTGRFVPWSNTVSYPIGSTVYDPATVAGGVKFYISTQTNSTIGDSPLLTSSEWLEVGSGSGFKQTTTVSLDNTVIVPVIFTVPYTNISLPNLPVVEVSVLTDNIGTVEWESVQANVIIQPSENEVVITFTGDFSEIINTSNNIKIDIS